MLALAMMMNRVVYHALRVNLAWEGGYEAFLTSLVVF